MYPRRPVKPPQVLVEGVLVVWGTRIDRLSVPGLPQLDFTRCVSRANPWSCTSSYGYTYNKTIVSCTIHTSEL